MLHRHRARGARNRGANLPPPKKSKKKIIFGGGGNWANIVQNSGGKLMVMDKVVILHSTVMKIQMTEIIDILEERSKDTLYFF